MIRKKNVKLEKLTDHITYRIINDTVYLFQDDNNTLLDDWEVMSEKLSLLLDDNDINYINLSTKNMEKKKEIYQNLGFTLSYYDVNKLNLLYSDVDNKKLYKCYGIMTKNDFLIKMNNGKKEKNSGDINVVSDNSGFISNMLLLFFGIMLLCYFCVEGAIYLVK